MIQFSIQKKENTNWPEEKKWFCLFLKNVYCYSITVVCIFSPSLHHTPAKPTSLPRLRSPPWFCPCVLYSSSCNPLSPLSPPHTPLLIVRLFLISMSLVIFCLLFSSVDYVPVKGEIIWYLFLSLRSFQSAGEGRHMWRELIRVHSQVCSGEDRRGLEVQSVSVILETFYFTRKYWGLDETMHVPAA